MLHSLLLLLSLLGAAQFMLWRIIVVFLYFERQVCLASGVAYWGVGFLAMGPAGCMAFLAGLVAPLVCLCISCDTRFISLSVLN